MKPDRQTVRKIGLSHVRNQLSRRGWEVMPPAVRTRGVDFLAHDREGPRTLTLKVRTLSGRAAVPLGATLDNLLADYMVVCSRAIEPDPECFILTTEEVKELANRNEKDGKVSHWLELAAYETGRFRERWDRMGRGAFG
jgi:hypothetical protein